MRKIVFNSINFAGAERNKTSYLDGLRGLAALGVLICHFLAVFYPASANGSSEISHFFLDIVMFNSPFSFLYNGQFAVCIFFVLSGYVLTKSYFDEGDEKILIKRLIARYPRLLIPAAISIVLVYLLLKFNLYEIKELALLTSAEKIVNYQQFFIFPNTFKYLFKNIFFTTWLDEPELNKMFNLVLWTMPIEFKGSLLVLTTAFLVSHIKYKKLVILMIAGLFILVIKPYGIYYAAFFLGLLLASCRIKATRQSNYWVIPGIAVSLYFGGYNPDSQAYFFMSKISHTSLAHFTNPAILYYVIAATILIFIILNSTSIQKFLETPIILYFGYISFPLYLIHQPLIFSMCSISFLSTNKAIGYNLSALLALITLLLVTLPVSTFLRKTVDQFAIDVSHQFSNFMLLQSSQDKPSS